MNNELLRFVEPIYRFCAKRLSSFADAQDLAQEILLCVLQGINQSKIANLDAYVWKVAHNRYGRKVNTENKDLVLVHGAEYVSDFVEDFDSSFDESSDEFQAVFQALHTLSSTYRQILVEYYVHNLSVREISCKLGISAETVKWRLHVGREKVKERLSEMERNYEKIKMSVMCNGSFAPTRYVNTQVHKAIAKACYDAPLTIEEISVCTGIPTIYLEEPLEHMIYGDAIVQIGKKYATNFIITDIKDLESTYEYLSKPVIEEIADKLVAYITETGKIWRAIGFYGSDFPLSHLYHVLIPTLVFQSGDRFRENSSILPKDRPPRKDGGNGWFIVIEGVEELDDKFSGCNHYHYYSNTEPPAKFIYYWNGASYDYNLDNILRNARFFIYSIGPDNECVLVDDEDAAKALENGLCKKMRDRYYPAMPVLTSNEYQALRKWAAECHAIDAVWPKWIEALYGSYKSTTPKRLADQIGGNVDSSAYNIVALITKELTSRGLADKPEGDQPFTKNLLLVK